MTKRSIKTLFLARRFILHDYICQKHFLKDQLLKISIEIFIGMSVSIVNKSLEIGLMSIMTKD